MNLSDVNLNEFISIDVETTGLDIYDDKIIEISAVKFKNEKIVDKFTKFINPNRRLSAFIQNLTGIRNEDVNNAPYFKEISKDFIEFIGNSPIVGHNIKFDIDFINCELNGFFDLYDLPIICDTYFLSRIFLYDFHSYKLTSLCNHFKINLENSHRAEDDAINTGYLFIRLLEYALNSSLDTIDYLNKTYTDSMSINKQLFSNIINCYLNENDNIPSSKLRKVVLNNPSFSYNENGEIKSLNNSIFDIFKKDGILDSKLEKYKYRKSQYDFASEFEKTINRNEISVVEAETGLGKTYGYLIPALMMENKKIVISTSTHNLQEQLFKYDIPIISKMLKLSIHATIVKGMKNYICKYRLDDLLNNIELLNNEERYELQSLLLWLQNTFSGDISECNSFKIWKYKKIWDLICFEYEYCNHHKNNNSRCFYSMLKNNIDSSNLLIINHSLLASFYDKEDSIINDSNICIIDEAHKFSENCQMHLKESINKHNLKSVFDSFSFSSLKVLDDNRINKNYNNLYNQVNNLRDRSIDVLQLFEDMSLSFSNYKFNIKYNNYSNSVHDVRYQCSDEEFYSISPTPNDFLNSFKYYVSLVIDFKNLLDKSNLVFLNKIKKINYTIAFNNIIEIEKILLRIFDKQDGLSYVHWLSISYYKDKIQLVTFNRAPLLIHTVFNDISSRFDSVLLTSATLTTNNDFDYILDDLGLNQGFINKNFNTQKYNSPFNMENQLKLFVNNNYLDINSNEYMESIYELVKNINNNLQKRMLVLCTSYKQISDLKLLFSNYELNKNLFFQDNLTSRQTILEQYLLHENSILFGTSSFWEGVDLPEDKLEILIIVKMPFSNPYNPIVQAKRDIFINRNMDPFNSYQLSEAVLKLKQGIGRLIRKENDKGICIITDPRILKRNYGNVVLDSLPVEAIRYKFDSMIIDESKKFLGT